MEWINFKDRLPKTNQRIIVFGEMWKHKQHFDDLELDTVYLGWNEIIGQPLIDHETFDEYYLKLIRWKPYEEE